MTEQNSNNREWFSGRSFVMGLCGLLLCGAMVLWSLHLRHAPWRLWFVSPSGLDESDYIGVDSWGSQSKYADVKDDERLLLLGKCNGSAEVWNLNTGKREKTISLSYQASEFNKERPGLGGVLYAEFVNSGESLLLDVGDKLYLSGWPEGAPSELKGLDKYMRARAVSPDGKFLAQAEIDTLWLYDLRSVDPDVFSEKNLLWKHTLTRVNGSYELSWSPDGKRLLLKDLCGIRLLDAKDGNVIMEIPELDFRLPWPFHADELSGYSSQNQDGTPGKLMRDDSKVAGIYHARFVDGGKSCLVSFAAQSMGIFERPSDGLLRKYDLESGEVIWEQKIGQVPRSLELSEDGKHFIVITVIDTPNGFCDRVRRYNVTDGRITKEVMISDAYRHYSGKFALSPDNSSVIAGSENTWIFDLEKRVAPFRLVKGSKASEVQWLDENLILVYGRETTARVFKRARHDSAAGLWALWETWVLHALGILAGLMVIIYAGRKTQLERGESLPRMLWVLMLTLGVLQGVSFAGGSIDLLVREFYDPAYKESSAAKIFLSVSFNLLWWIAVYGVMRLYRGWYLFILFWIGLGMIYLLSLSVKTALLLSKLDEADVSQFFHGDIKFPLYWHAWFLHVSPVISLVGLLLLSIWLIALWLLLFRPQIRGLFPKSAES